MKFHSLEYIFKTLKDICIEEMYILGLIQLVFAVLKNLCLFSCSCLHSIWLFPIFCSWTSVSICQGQSQLWPHKQSILQSTEKELTAPSSLFSGHVTILLVILLIPLNYGGLNMYLNSDLIFSFSKPENIFIFKITSFW